MRGIVALRPWAACALVFVAAATGTAKADAGEPSPFVGSGVAAFVGDALQDSSLVPPGDRSLAEPGSIYLARRAGGRPTRVEVHDTEPVRKVLLSPRLDRLAYSVMREVSCDPSYSVRIRFVVVADTAGTEVAALPGVQEFAWSPDGERLAVAYGPEGLATPDSIAVVDLGDRAGTTYPLRFRFVEWLDSSNLVLEEPGVALFDLEKAKNKALRRGGRFISPDRHFSFTAGDQGLFTLSDDEVHQDLTRSIARLIRGGRVASSPPAFWVGRPGGHTLCLPVRVEADPGSSNSRTAGLRAYLIDMDGPKVARILTGAPVAPTPDGRALLLYQDGEFRFEDL